MKTKSTLIIATAIAITIFGPQKSSGQQAWLLTGNNNANNNSKLGTLTDFPIHFFAGSTNWMNLETDGRVNITAPGLAQALTKARLAVNSSPGQDPFRVMINGNTRFLVNEKGGVSIGTTTEGPAKGLYVNGSTGIGIAEPKTNLHVFRGSSGTVTPNANSPLIVENNTNSYISVLAPSSSEKGIIFGDNVRPVNGAILYNSSDNMLFQTQKVTRMILTATGNLGIGTAAPAVKLHVTGGSDAGLNGGFIVTGDLASDNMGIDNNEIQTRIGGVASTLYLNNDGGDINLRSDAMHITNGKLIGIGTASPTNKFHVVGTSFFSGNVGINRTVSATRDLILGSSIQIGSVESLFDGGSDLMTCSASFTPTSDNSSSLGSSGARWTAVWAADGTINTSDLRDKKNIRDLDYGLSKIMQLHPVKFNWKEGINTGDKVGLVAQEIQKVLPEVVRDYDIRTDEATGKQEKVPSARLGVVYTDLIPVLIKSIQELETQVAELKKQVNDKTSITSSASDEVKKAKAAANAILEQNNPNPFNSNTTIRYNIPASVSSAQIMITNGSGNMIKTFTLINKGAGSVTIKAGELTAGNYYYTLVVDGKKVDSKQMILIK